MAQDLSQTIQEGLAQTLTDLLGIDARFEETTQVDRRDLKESQLLEVNAEFEFDKLVTTIKFMIPATSASIIFNTMMGAADSDIAKVIDDDTTDAMGEFVSNVSGSLVTAFNAKEIAELGNAKFHIQHKEIIDGASIENVDNSYRFLIDLNDQPILIFINFKEEFLPFIEEITKTEPTPYPEEETPEVPEEEIEKIEEKTPEVSEVPEEEIVSNEPTIKNVPKEEESSDTKEDEPLDEESEKKSKKMKLLIIILASLIGLIIIIFLIILLMGSSDEEEMEKTEEKKEMVKNKQEEIKKVPEITIETTKTLKKIDFNIKDIDIGRLNSRLATLTKYEILTKEELEKQKQEENKRLARLKKEEELKEFAKLNKEEPIKLPTKPIKEKKTTTHKKEQKEPVTIDQEKKEKTTPITLISEQPIMEKETIKESSIKENTNKKPNKEVAIEKETPQPKKLLFVLTNSIKYNLFKSLVTQLNASSARISMCNDTEGRTTILIGPFKNLDEQMQMDELIKNSNENIITTLSELSQEEFNQRCDF